MKRLLCALLAGVMLLTLSSCRSAFEREYYYETPYSGDIGPRSDKATEVRNYSMLKTALTNMIVNHMEKGELRFRNYNGNLSEDLAAACFEIKSAHPLGAYAVESLSYDTSYVVSYYMANIYISYKRTAEELKSIIYTFEAADFDRYVEQAAERFEPKLVIRCYASGVDEDYVREHVKRHYYDDPVTSVLEPETEVTSYPADGVNRIFDIRFTCPISVQRIQPMSMALAGKLEEAAASMTETEPPRLALECAQFLSDHCAGAGADSPYAGTAYGPLMNGSADSKGYALAYRALCDRLGLDCTVVEGSYGTMEGEPHFWNIIALDGAHYHVDVSAFADDPAAAFLRGDDELWGAYLWDTSDYPACGGTLTYAEVAGIPESAEPTAAEEAATSPASSSTQTPSVPEGTQPSEESEPPASEHPDGDAPTEPEETPAPKPDAPAPDAEKADGEKAEKTP